MRVDMYLLRDDSEPDELACRLTGKAWPASTTVQILCNDSQQCQSIDKLLWQLPGNRFIAHQVTDANQPVNDQPVQAPVSISMHHQPSVTSSVLIELRDRPEIIDDSKGISRVLDIVANSDAARTNARQRYKAYRQLTTELHTHELPTKS